MMLPQAFRHEFRRVYRSPSSLLAVVVFIAASVVSIWAGHEFRNEWLDGLHAAAEIEAEAIADVRGWFDAGEKGPEDRPWIDVHQPRWQDWYAGTRVHRLPAPLAGIAAGSIDDTPRVVRINRRTNPFQSEGSRIENPEFGRTARMDLIFLITVFVPLLIGVLGLGCGARERESGMARVIAIQRGRTAPWFLARSFAISAIVGTIVLCVTLAAAGLADASSGDTAWLAAIALLYTLLWGGLLTLTAVAARSVREAAVAYGLTWVVIVVLIPALLSERALAEVSVGDSVLDPLESRTERYATFEADADSTLPILYAGYPHLETLPAAELDELPGAARRLVFDGLSALATRDRHTRTLDAEEHAIEQTSRRMIWSPTVTFALAAESLAGRDQLAAMTFRSSVVSEMSERVRWVLEETWQTDPLSSDDFEALLSGRLEPVRPRGGDARPHAAVLSIWALAAWVVGGVRVRREDG